MGHCLSCLLCGPGDGWIEQKQGISDTPNAAPQSLSHDGLAAAERDEDGETDGVDGGRDVEDGDPASAGHLEYVSGEVHADEPFRDTQDTNTSVLS